MNLILRIVNMLIDEEDMKAMQQFREGGKKTEVKRRNVSQEERDS